MKTIITAAAAILKNLFQEDLEKDYRSAFRNLTDSMNESIGGRPNVEPIWEEDEVAVSASIGRKYIWGRSLYGAVSIEISKSLRETKKGEKYVGVTQVCIAN